MIQKMLSHIQKIGIFDLCVRGLIILLPFTTFITVIGKQKLWLTWIWFFKEILICIIILTLAWNIRSKKIVMKWSLIDAFIGIYIVNLLIVSVFTTGISGIVYGGRYDFAFLIAFWWVYHGYELLREWLSYYLRLFLYSCGAMVAISALLKFPFSEDLLLYAGYSGNPSAWDFSWAPPIFHGIDGANVRRFQWILDGPNTMWAFLIFLSGIFAYYFRSFKDWYFVNGVIFLGFFVMIIYTYSRSALLGMILAILVVLLWSIGFIFKKYKKEFWVLSVVVIVLSSLLIVQYSGRLDAIIWRAWSTQGHMERMTTWVERFVSAPLGQWLGSAWPAYRYVKNLQWVQREDVEKEDRYYIPESWYIQQFIEGWVIGGVLFILIMATLFFWLLKKHIFLAAMLVAIGVMNFFLHTFESSPFSLLFFIILWLILWSQLYGKRTTRKN